MQGKQSVVSLAVIFKDERAIQTHTQHPFQHLIHLSLHLCPHLPPHPTQHPFTLPNIVTSLACSPTPVLSPVQHPICLIYLSSYLFRTYSHIYSFLPVDGNINTWLLIDYYPGVCSVSKMLYIHPY